MWNELRLGQVYDVLGQREKALQQYKYVLSFKDKWGFDELAKTLLKTPYRVPADGDVGPLPPKIWSIKDGTWMNPAVCK